MDKHLSCFRLSCAILSCAILSCAILMTNFALCKDFAFTSLFVFVRYFEILFYFSYVTFENIYKFFLPVFYDLILYIPFKHRLYDSILNYVNLFFLGAILFLLYLLLNDDYIYLDDFDFDSTVTFISVDFRLTVNFDFTAKKPSFYSIFQLSYEYNFCLSFVGTITIINCLSFTRIFNCFDFLNKCIHVVLYGILCV